MPVFILNTVVAHKPNLLDPEPNVVFTSHQIELDQTDSVHFDTLLMTTTKQIHPSWKVKQSLKPREISKYQIRE